MDGELVRQEGREARQFEDWADAHLPERSVVEASLFRYQKSEGFVEMDSADRIAVLLRVIGVARLERKAEIARGKAKEQKEKLDELLRRIEDIRGGDQGVEAAQSSLDTALATASSADASQAAAKGKLGAAQEAAAAHAVRKTAREAADKLMATLEEQAKGAAERRADAERRIEGNRQIQADADAIRAAASGLAEANAELTRLEFALVEADKQIAALLGPWRDGAARARAAQTRRSQAQARLADQAKVEAAVAGKGALEAAVAAQTAVVSQLDAEAMALNAKKWAGAEERIGGLRAGHHRAIEIGDVAPCASALDQDDATVKAAKEIPVQQIELGNRLKHETGELMLAERHLAEAERLAARAGDVAVAKEDLSAAEQELAEILTGHALAVLGAVLRALGRLAIATEAKAQAARLEPMRKLSGRLSALEDSARRMGELQDLAAAAMAEETKLLGQLATVDRVEVGEAPDVAAAQRALVAAEAAAVAARAEVVKAEQTLARSREVAGKLDSLLGERADVEAELADWTRMALDHGRSGQQSDEVDAAGPELTGYINGCLRECVGTRWTVTVETQRLDAKGKNLVDKCIIMVLDNETSDCREVKEHSGGERTSLAEAISSGLTMLGCRCAGFDRPTLVRDESSNFLDPEASLVWVRMMRHVVKYTNADRVLFVSHNPEVVRLADATIEIPNQRGAQQQAA
jgi:exonuclease SbcC